MGETSKGCRGCIVHIYVSLDDSKAIVGENVKCLLKVRGNITQWRASLKHKKRETFEFFEGIFHFFYAHIG